MSFFFPRHDENTRTCWGHSFQLTPDHPTAEDMEPLKFEYDKLGDQALARLDELAPPPRLTHKMPTSINTEAADPIASSNSDDSPGLPTLGPVPQDQQEPLIPQLPKDPSEKAPPSRPAKRDLYVLLRENAATDPVLGKLWTEVTTVPEWVDWEQIGRGQDVFYRYGMAAFTGLAFQSLLGGLGATRVVETLTRTGGFAGPVIRHRLLETTQHILQVTASIAALQPPALSGSSTDPRAGTGFASTVRVRLLHAAVRSRILALVAADKGYYSVARNGIPINDLDNTGTALTFSATLLFLSLPRQGIYATAREADDYTALWRYVAHVLGAPTEPLRSAATARRWMESLLMHEIAPSRTSQVLANNIVAGLARQPPSFVSPEFLVAQARWLNGDQLCDALALPRPHFLYKGLVAGQCAFFAAVAYAYRAVPAWDRWKVAKLRVIFWTVIVENKQIGALGAETVFDFKYVPTPGKRTVADRGRGWVRGRAGRAGRIERRGAFSLGAMAALVAALAYLLFRAVVSCL